jgi:hypothetical protein
LEYFYFCGTDERKAESLIDKYSSEGYHVFCYKSYANSQAMWNKRFISYSHEAISFIMLHEFVHHFVFFNNLKIPYEFHEALADVVGNYGTLEFSRETDFLNIDSVQQQIKINEDIYELMNSTIDKININPSDKPIIHHNCHTTISELLLKGNLFQRDRFEFPVNNAFLLKNSYYSKNYFLLKKVYEKQRSIKALLKILKSMPESVIECEAYLKNYLLN